MTLNVKVNGKRYVWDKHSPSIWKTEKGNVVKSKKLLATLERLTETKFPLPPSHAESEASGTAYDCVSDRLSLIQERPEGERCKEEEDTLERCLEWLQSEGKGAS